MTLPINAIYALPTDELASLATVSISAGSQRGSYAPSNLQLANMMKPAKLNEQTGAFLYTFSGAQRIDLVACTNHNLDAGLTVYVEGNTTNTWSPPALQAAITIPPWRAAPPTVAPTSIAGWADLTGAAGYTPVGYPYWRIVVVGTNSVPIAIARVVLVPLIRQFTPNNYLYGGAGDDAQPIYENKTSFGVPQIYYQNLRSRTATLPFKGVPSAQLAAMDALWQTAGGRANPFLLIPDQRVNDAWYVRAQKPNLPRTPTGPGPSWQPGYDQITWTVEEVERGPIA